MQEDEEQVEIPPKKKPKFTAQNKLMDYLARRDHSEKELREKLKKNFSHEEIDRAIQHAKDHGWMLDPTELAEKTALSLNRKGKGNLYIQQYLQNKGLPPLSAPIELEEERAMELTDVLVERGSDIDKLQRYLKNRGYSIETIRRTIDLQKTRIS